MSSTIPSLNGVKIFAITGHKQVGKDTLIDRLVQEMSFEGVEVHRLSFSDELRTIAHQVFPWLPLDPSPEVKDSPFNHPKNKGNMSPRDIWKRVADDETGICSIQEDVLVDKFLENQILSGQLNQTDIYVIKDVRKQCEYNLVRECNIPIIRIENPPEMRPNSEDNVECLISGFDVDQVLVHNKTDETQDMFIRLVKSIIYGEAE